MKIDFLIVGQGLAGTILSYTLRQAGCTVRVIDKESAQNSSRVAAGIFNPITGRKLVKTWYGDPLFNYLHDFYPAFERFLDTRFFYHRDVYVPFDSQEKQNTWTVQSSEPEYEPYIKGFYQNLYPDTVEAPFGGMCITKAGYVDIPAMLDAYRKELIENEILIEKELVYGEISHTENGVAWQGLEAKMLIFADGTHSAFNNPYFKWLAFRPVKGEVLTVEFPETKFEHIVNRGCWILPQDNGQYRVGATYDNHDMTETPTSSAKNKILEKLEALTTAKYKIIEHKAGIRPATYDRRPFLGIHPIYKQIGVFNGLGAKGVSLAPYFAQHFVEVLLNDKTLMGLVDIERVIRRYNVKNEVLAKL